jgi:5-formyltetrahydrofolate cyclo-ligase
VTLPGDAEPDEGLVRTTAERKAWLRQRVARTRAVRAARAASGSDDSGEGASIARRLTDLTEVAAAGCVAMYVSLPGEPPAAAATEALRARGARVLLPSVRPDLDLDFREYAGVLVAGALGTREPPRSGPLVDLAVADVVVTPAVAGDRGGGRLGRGGGSYDRALRRVAMTAFVVALLHDDEVIEEVPTDEHDLPVHAIVTPRRTIRCR